MSKRRYPCRKHRKALMTCGKFTREEYCTRSVRTTAKQRGSLAFRSITSADNGKWSWIEVYILYINCKSIFLLLHKRNILSNVWCTTRRFSSPRFSFICVALRIKVQYDISVKNYKYRKILYSRLLFFFMWNFSHVKGNNGKISIAIFRNNLYII